MKWKRICERIVYLLFVSVVFWLIFLYVPNLTIQQIAKPFALASTNHVMLELLTIALLPSIKSPRMLKALTFGSDLIVVLIWTIAAVVEISVVTQIFRDGFVS